MKTPLTIWRSRGGAIQPAPLVAGRVREYADKYEIKPEEVLAHISGRLHDLHELSVEMQESLAAFDPVGDAEIGFARAVDVLTRQHEQASEEFLDLWRPMPPTCQSCGRPTEWPQRRCASCVPLGGAEAGEDDREHSVRVATPANVPGYRSSDRSAPYSWGGWFDGAADCEPPEPGKEWLTIEDSDGNELAIIVLRTRGKEDYELEEERAQSETQAQAIVDALNAVDDAVRSEEGPR